MSENKGKRAIKRKQECNCTLKAHTTQTHNKTSHINLKKAKATQMEWENSSAVQCNSIMQRGVHTGLWME